MMGSPENVSAELRQTDQWICWRIKMRDGKETKIPVEPGTGEHASTDDPTTWTSFREALQFSMQGDAVDGIGFVFTDEDPYVGVDLDNCREPDSGEMDAWATDVIQTLDSYTEVSPSGTGAHILIIADKPGDRNRKDDIEIYETGRYFTVSGAPFPDRDGDIEERQRALETVYDEYIGEETTMDTSWIEDGASTNGNDHSTTGGAVLSANGEPPSGPSGNGKASAENGERAPTADTSNESASVPGLSRTNAALVQHALNAANGEKFQQLWEGNWKGRYESQSEADMAFCSMLAFWTDKDPHRMDTIFRQSGLMRDKWDADRGTETYGQKTISKALGHVTDTFDHSNLDLDDEQEQNAQSTGQPSDPQRVDNGGSPVRSAGGHQDSPAEDRASSTTQSNQTEPDQTPPTESNRRDPEVRGSQAESRDHNPGRDSTDTDQSTSESHRRDDTGASRTTTTQYFEDWYTQILDFQGSVPPWVEQIAGRIQELEGEVDRNEQLMKHWKKKAEQQEEEITRLQQRIDRLEAALDVEDTAHEQPFSESEQPADGDDDSGRFGFLGL
jgi:putative DNA primase/helicase